MDNDRITMRIQHPQKIQLVLHHGAKKLEQPKGKIIQTNSNLLTWKENDRAIATFNNLNDIENNKPDLTTIVRKEYQRLNKITNHQQK